MTPEELPWFVKATVYALVLLLAVLMATALLVVITEMWGYILQ